MSDSFLFPPPSPGMCDWGRCCDPAAFRVRFARTSTGKVAEVRKTCAAHVVDAALTGRCGGEFTVEAESL